MVKMVLAIRSKRYTWFRFSSNSAYPPRISQSWPHWFSLQEGVTNTGTFPHVVQSDLEKRRETKRSPCMLDGRRDTKVHIIILYT